MLRIIDDENREIAIPFTWQICSSCGGHGKSSAHLGAFTADEMAEEGPDFQDDYMSGFYDRTCDNCGGAGKVKVADLAKMNPALRKEYREAQAEDRAERRERAMERAMGA